MRTRNPRASFNTVNSFKLKVIEKAAWEKKGILEVLEDYLEKFIAILGVRLIQHNLRLNYNQENTVS